MSNEIKQSELEKVTQICQDGYLGYQSAANNLEDEELTTIFNRLAQQRKLFSEELKADARTLGYQLDDNGSTQGFFHRGWLNVKDFFSTSENSAVIETSLTGERKAKEVYEEVLKEENMPRFIKDRLNEQLSKVTSVITQLERMNEHVS